MSEPTQASAGDVRAVPAEWRCFHCDEVFTDEAEARLHFGDSCVQEPICGVTAERYREVERQLEEYRSESDATSKTFYSLGAEHYRKERDAEQAGYDRGLADAKAHPGELGLARLNAAPAVSDGLRGSLRDAKRAAELVCHEDQMIVWADEFLDHIRDIVPKPADYETVLSIHAAIASGIRDVVEKAFTHSELAALASPDGDGAAPDAGQRPSPSGDAVRVAIATFNRIVDQVESRCLAADGPVTPTLQEMREDELATLWQAVQFIALSLQTIFAEQMGRQS